MRKIKISQSLKNSVEDFNNNLFVNTRGINFNQPLDLLEQLRSKLTGTKNQDFRTYITEIISNYHRILNADPNEMKLLIQEFDTILNYRRVNKKFRFSKYPFHQLVVNAMRYEDLREKEFPNHLLNSNLSLKTCVYCNAQSAIIIEPLYYNQKRKKRKKTLAKFQLDHFHPKSKYPFLCTSFFNLYPTCANCNLAKGKENAKFELYTSENNLDCFKFWIDDYSIIQYWTLMKRDLLKINFESMDGNYELLHNHNNLFQIQRTYDYNKDIGEELIWKAKAYPDVYRHILSEQFKLIFPDPSYIDRMIIGNYSSPEETFKRPMAKYTQDLAKQLKLI